MSFEFGPWERVVRESERTWFTLWGYRDANTGEIARDPSYRFAHSLRDAITDLENDSVALDEGGFLARDVFVIRDARGEKRVHVQLVSLRDLGLESL